MDTRSNFRFPPDSPYREQRLTFQQSNPEVRNEPPVVESPRERIAGKLKGAVDALGRDPDVRAAAERKVLELRAKSMVKRAFDDNCANRTWAGEHGSKNFGAGLGADNTLVVFYTTQEGRYFMGPTIDVGAPGARMDANSLRERIAAAVSSPDTFNEVIAPRVNLNN